MTNSLTKCMTIIITCLLLTACNETKTVTEYRYMVAHPDEAMYYCPVLKKIPDWRTLTDAQVAQTVVTLYKNNITCKSSLESIREFLRRADKKREG